MYNFSRIQHISEDDITRVQLWSGVGMLKRFLNLISMTSLR